MGKLLTLEQAKKIRANLKADGKIVVFTNGVFDLLHAGHTSILSKAKALGNILIVGMNSDQSVKAIKGESRPVMDENVRSDMLCALPPVDYVVIFSEKTPEKLLAALKPDIHVKGGDWEGKELPEQKLVESWGGKVKIVQSGESVSTTKLIEEMKRKGGK
ncbi:MAG: D-glycero-beta-D-manno-heptose 1-phosphate adenylyltransferase [Candidatus Micrarchaeota archaeon]|nr:D-glycero-beta-D-manno-heptose 1-phosphate adenylyltransferase [Candidatus Micrarchaeota archaeon]